jgi:6-phosphogluconolactonase (cycloisomerase 2 family)
VKPPENGSFCHFHACRNGWILYDSSHNSTTYIGLVDLDSLDYKEWPVDNNSYCHVGHDREGRFLFASIDNFNNSKGHHIAAIKPKNDGKADIIRLTDNLPTGRNQFCHAHPVLTPDRMAIIYTALGDDDKTHLFKVDISDLDTNTIDLS